MAIHKILIISGTTLAVTLAGVAGAGVVSAQSETVATNSIVDKIAQKFNVNKADVQKVFDEDHEAREAEHKAELKTTLDQAVKDGKITADQEAKLIAKLDEMHAAREKARTNTSTAATDRHAAMQKERTDFEAWLKANNIPTDLVPQFGKGRGGMEMGRHSGESTSATSFTAQ